MYAGKPVGESGLFYICETEEIAKSLVNFLESHLNIQRRNISFDRFYISISLENWCLQQNITMRGTIMTNRKGGGSIKSLDSRKNLSSKFYCEKEKGKLSITPYVVNTKLVGKRNIFVLSTMSLLLGFTKDDGIKKPAIIKLYDFTEGAGT